MLNANYQQQRLSKPVVYLTSPVITKGIFFSPLQENVPANIRNPQRLLMCYSFQYVTLKKNKFLIFFIKCSLACVPLLLVVMGKIVLPSAPTSSNPLSSTFSKLQHKEKKKSRQNYFYPVLAMLGSLSCRLPTLYLFPFFGPKEPHKPSPYPVFFSILAFVTSSSSSSSRGY